MKAVVQRLKKGSEKTFETGWKQGVILGTKWATKYLHLSDLRRIGEGKLTFDKDDYDVEDWIEHKYGCPRFDSEQDEINYARDTQYQDTVTATLGKNAGFVDAVKNVWEEVRPSFTDDQ